MKRMLAVTLIVVAGLFMLSASSVMAGPLAGIPCNGNFDGDLDVDAIDVAEFLIHFGRSPFNDPCPPVPPAPVEKTGQTTSYATGDDGDLEKGVSLPTPRFTDNMDGSTTDNLTGLIWLRDAFCFALRTWDDAIADCNELASGFCGLTDGSQAGDWRLPNKRELISLTHDGYYNPALSNTAGTGQMTHGDPFVNVINNCWWSSTTHPTSTFGARCVYMANGNVSESTKGTSYGVWCVRDPL